MKAKKKNRFLTFCCSLMPGAAEMYMGFMKMGLSLMVLFFLFILVGAMFGGDVIAVSCMVVVWCYGFFHANHLAVLSDEEFSQIEDQYLIGKDTLGIGKHLDAKWQKWIAAALIFIGVCFLWDSVAGMLYDLLPEGYGFIATMMWRIGDYIPKLLAGVVIIVIGISLIVGKKAQLSDEVLTVENGGRQEDAYGEESDQN